MTNCKFKPPVQKCKKTSIRKRKKLRVTEQMLTTVAIIVCLFYTDITVVCYCLVIKNPCAISTYIMTKYTIRAVMVLSNNILTKTR